MPKYVSAKDGPQRSVIYTDSDGGKPTVAKSKPGKPGARCGEQEERSHRQSRQITGVRKDKKGTIQSYRIEEYGWVSKAEGIRLASAGEVDAVVATSPRGNLFLRARPNSDVSDNLEIKG
jgi:hypothetical protein